MNYIPKYTITEKIRSNLREIERLKDHIRGSRILPAAEASIRLRASVEAIHSSTSIEGNPLDSNQVRALVAADRILSPEEYAEIEVQNYKNALDFIDQRRHGSPDLTMQDILELHKIITARLLDTTRNGKFRQNPVYIENQDHQILYTAADAAQVTAAVQSLIDFVQANQFTLNPVIIAAIIHLCLAAIHPFADGNGRTARAATTLYLSFVQYDCGGALVLDSYYATDRRAYYNVLQLVNGHDYQSFLQADITPWLEYFTDGFLTSLHVLDAEIRMLKIAIAGQGRHDASALSREEQDLLSYATEFGSITIAEAENILPESSRRSAQRYLRQLVDAGFLEITGAARDTRYITKQ